MENNFKKTKYQIAILRPGGNDTMLIKGLVKDPAQKKIINDQVMRRFPSVEQVGFYDFNPNKNIATLEMAGGEFCGNALRSLAFLLLKGKPGKITARVSGTKKRLIAGVRNSQGYAQMPILKDFRSVKKINEDISQVTLEGISFLITLKPKISKNSEQLKQLGKKLLAKADLLTTVPASGVIFISKIAADIEIVPIVWVRDLETLFYETACASGTAAIGLFKSKVALSLQSEFSIKQPSGYYINSLVKKNKDGFKEAQIYGVIQLLDQKIIELEDQIND